MIEKNKLLCLNNNLIKLWLLCKIIIYYNNKLLKHIKLIKIYKKKLLHSNNN
jgi:hypothetical protein